MFFFNDTATTEIYTLSLHDALPIFTCAVFREHEATYLAGVEAGLLTQTGRIGVVAALDTPFIRRWVDRKSTRLNSSHANISYAVFCLKKKNNLPKHITLHIYSTITS